MKPFHAPGHPMQGPGQSLESHKADMAKWMGCETVEEMDRDHDPLHAELCQWMGSTSYSLLAAQGVQLPDNLRRIAELEECAVLNVQRWLQALKNEGLEVWVAF